MLKTKCVNLAIVLALLACFPSHNGAFAQAHKRAPQKTSHVPAGAPLTLDNVILLSQKVAPERVLEYLKTRDIDFSATEENMARLKDAKAAPEILDEVRTLSDLKAKNAPPKPAKTGSILLVTCVPAECEIRLNDKPFTTVNGEKKFEALNPEVFKVSASHEGYEVQEKPVDLRSAKPDDVTRWSFELKPTDATQAKWGDTLLKSMLAKAKISREAKQISGTLTIKDAQSAEWTLVAHIAAPGAAEIDMSNAQTHVSVTCVEGGCQMAGSKGSFMKHSGFRGPKQDQLRQEIFLLRHTERWLANEYSSLMLRLSGVHVLATTKVDPEGGQPKEFQVGTGAGAYLITLDDGLRPKSVKFSAATGLTGATVVTYSNYQHSYPALTEIRFSENDKQSLSFSVR